MNEPNTARAMRQTLGIDRLMGVSTVPLSSIEIPQEEHVLDTPKPNVATPKFSVNPVEPKPGVKKTAFNGTVEIPPCPEGDLTLEQRVAHMEELKAHFDANYENWGLFDPVTNTVFGEGNPDARLLFIGEGPGADEDRTGRPFVGRAGQKLNDMIAAMGLAREEVYIANIVKCRPPGNRVPTLEEAAACMPYLLRQIDMIRPEVMVCLGATATKYLLDDQKIAITKMRGTWQTFHGIDLMPTFHPAYLLRAYTPENRERVWHDLKAVMQKLDLPLPKRK